jgi:hypothetical protein
VVHSVAADYGRACSRFAILGTVLIGYAQVSTAEQNPAHQVDALIRAGAAVDDSYVDTASWGRGLQAPARRRPEAAGTPTTP